MSLKRFSTLTVMSLLTLANPIAALAGGGSDGGGAQIESAFRLRAYALIQEVSANSEAKELCSPALMKATLERTNIKVVNQLTNTANNQVITDQNLDAWTGGSVIQLKESSWQKFLNDPETKINGRTIDALTLHEIFRATESCNDERFVLSDQMIPLLQAGENTSRLFDFKTQSLVWESHGILTIDPTSNPGGNRITIFCDKEFEANKKMTCLNLSQDNKYQDIIEIFYVMGPSSHMSMDKKIIFRGRFLYSYDLPNLLETARLSDSEHPLHIVYDLESRRISYGLNLRQMRTVKTLQLLKD